MYSNSLKICFYFSLWLAITTIGYIEVWCLISTFLGISGLGGFLAIFFLLLVSVLILILSENTLCMISIILYFLRLGLYPRIWSILVNSPWTRGKIFILYFLSRVFYKYQLISSSEISKVFVNVKSSKYFRLSRLRNNIEDIM